MDAELLSRLQFAFTLSFHIIFPTITIGLAWFLAMLEFLWLKTSDVDYKRQYMFWSKIFAISFGMGVVSGVVLSYEFGTNFSRFSEAAGEVIGPLMGYEVLTAFFLEAGFLGIMLFGWKRVSPKLHFFATLMVATGTLISTFWIIAANSWMQTPTGHIFENGKFFVASWYDVIFNPSFPYRLAHMITASFLTTAFMVMGISAYWLLKGKHKKVAGKSLKLGIIFTAIVVPAQIVIGDLHGLNALQHQPMKVAAMEGLWETTEGANLLLFAIPDSEAEKNHYEVPVPGLASFILTHDWKGEVKGLKHVPKEDRPPVPIVFYSFRVMIGVGLLMLFAAYFGVVLLIKKTHTQNSVFLRLCLCLIPAGIIATLAGWYVAEVGRQPYIVYGLYRTSQGYTPIEAQRVLESLTLFILTYSTLMCAYLFYFARLVRKGPPAPEDTPDTQGMESRKPILTES